MSVLVSLISKDYELRGTGRWLKGVDHDSLVVDTERDLFFWNSKDISGDAFVWLTKIKNIPHLEAKSILRSKPDYSGIFISTISNSEEHVVYPRLVDIFHEEAIRNNKLEYWNKRGITLETVQRFKLGYADFYSDGFGFSTVPIYQDGIFKDFQIRRDVPEKLTRQYYGGGSLLFNSDILKLTDSIIITEGPTDCIRLSQEGIPCVSSTAGATGWQQHWFKYFIHQKNIFVVYDNDDAGRKGSKKVARNLGMYRTKVFTFDGYDRAYDIIKYFSDGSSLQNLLSLIYENSKFIFELEK